ncbi:MAG: hypothetical protein AMXMBFR33_01890 [Candidatus Xenobia bacterium]
MLPSVISNWENGLRTNVQLPSLLRLADALNVTLDELVGRSALQRDSPGSIGEALLQVDKARIALDEAHRQLKLVCERAVKQTHLPEFYRGAREYAPLPVGQAASQDAPEVTEAERKTALRRAARDKKRDAEAVEKNPDPFKGL